MDEVDTKRREWDAIYEREQTRRRNIEELREMMEKMGENRKTPKSLLKLAVYTNGVKASEAANIIGVKRELINSWLHVLMDRNLVVVESTTHPDPTIRPTSEVLEKFKEYQKRRYSKSGADEYDVGGFEEAVKIQPSAAEPADKKERDFTSEGGEVKLEAGMTYMVFDDKSEKSIRLFIKQIREGVRGLMVTRSNPNHVRKKYFLGDSRVVWLTSVQTDKEIESVSGLQELSILVSNFIDSSENGIILLDGIEYLVSNNNFPVVLRMIQQLRDKVSTSDAKMLIPVNRKALDERQLELLENECETIQ